MCILLLKAALLPHARLLLKAALLPHVRLLLKGALLPHVLKGRAAAARLACC